MASSIAEFRARYYRDITLPSGLAVRMRQVQAIDFIGLGDLPIPAGPLEDGAKTIAPMELMAMVTRYTHRGIVRAVIDPPMHDALDDGGAPVILTDKLHVTELMADDYAALASLVIQQAGLTVEDARATDAFRQDQVSPDGESLGGHVPVPAL